MGTKKKLLVLPIILTLFSSPVYSQGYENINRMKLGFQLIFYLVIFIAVIFATLYGTKLIAKNAKGMANSKYIQLLDVINIPGGSKIIIAKINDKIYLLSTTNNGVNIMDIIEEKDFPMVEENFDTYLDRYLIKNKLNYSKINGNLKSFFNKFKRIKDKEDKKR